MKGENYKMLTNAELRIKIEEMTNKYEALKIKIKNHLEEMERLDKEYNKAKTILEKRTKGKI